MQKVTVKYGVESFDKEFTSTPTFGQVVGDQTVKAVLGFGDNVRCLVDGVEMSQQALVPQGVVVRIETRANSKAGLITIIVGSSTINKDVDENYTAEQVLDCVMEAGLTEGMDEPTAYSPDGVVMEYDHVIPAGSTVVVKDANRPCCNQRITCLYGVEQVEHDLAPGETFGQLAANQNVKGVLGFGDNVRLLIDGVEQNSASVIPPGVTVRFETRANSKA